MANATLDLALFLSEPAFVSAVGRYATFLESICVFISFTWFMWLDVDE